MRKRSKVLISVLLLMAMLGSMIPATAFVASAATSFSYVLDTSGTIAPDEEYLIVSAGSDGTAYALTPASGASGENKTSTSSVAVNISGGVIAGTDALVASEWKFIKSARTASGAPDLYMVYNPSTSAFLWNPSYEDGSTTNIGTALTPTQDQYNGGTIAVFNFPNTKNPTIPADTENIITAYNTAGAMAFDGNYLIHDSKTGDGWIHFNFARTSLEAATWKYVAYTDKGLHAGGTGGRQTKFYTSTSTCAGDSESYRYFYSDSYGSWKGRSMDFYTSVENDGWKSGTINHIRLDPYNEQGSANKIDYIDSIIVAKTVPGVEILAKFRSETADKRGGGLMPSAEYPFCQAGVFRNGNGFNIKFYSNANDNNNVNGYANCLTPAASAGASFTKNTTETAVYLFKKTGDVTWNVVNDLKSGGDYLLMNTNASGATASFYGFNSTFTSAGVNTRTINGTTITSTSSPVIGNNAKGYSWTAVKAGEQNGKSYYFLVNNHKDEANRYYLVYDGTNITSTTFKPTTAVDGKGQYGWNYLWTYDSANHVLYASHPDKSCYIDTGYAMGYSGANLVFNNSSAKVYLAEKSYHTHEGTRTEIARTPATCTENGSVTYRWSGCGHEETEVLTAPGHSYGAWQNYNNAQQHRRQCANCDNYEYADHVWSDWTTTVGPNGSGTHSRTCTVCGYAQSGEHNWDGGEVHAATCVDDGYTRYTCETCGETYDEPGEAAGGAHDWDTGVLVTEPTCTEAGSRLFTCHICKSTKTEPIPAVGHFYDANGNCVMGCNDNDSNHHNNSYVDNGSVRYYYVDKPIGGNTYAIANTNSRDSGYIASATDGDGVAANDTIYLQSIPTSITLSSNVYGTYVENVGLTSQWLYNANKSFKNEKTNEYLWGRKDATGAYDEWIHHNIGSDDALFTFQSIKPAVGTVGSTSVNSGVGTQILGNDGQYLDFKDVVSTAGFTLPGQGMVKETANEQMVLNGDNVSRLYLPICGFTDSNGNDYFTGDDAIDNNHIITPNCTIDFDFTMTANTSLLAVMRPDMVLGMVTGVRIIITAGYVFAITPVDKDDPDAFYVAGSYRGQKCLCYAQIPGFTYGENEWRHFRLVSTMDGAEKNVKIYIDGKLLLTVNNWAFYTPDDSHLSWPVFMNEQNKEPSKFFTLFGWSWVDQNSLGLPKATLESLSSTLGTGSHPNAGDGDTYIDNVSALSRDTGFYIYDTYDKNANGVNDGNIYYQDPTAHILDERSTEVVNQDGVIANNVFVADSKDTNRLYLYEKRYLTTVEYYVDGVKQTSLTDTAYKALFKEENGNAVAETFSSQNKCPSGAHLVKIDVNGTEYTGSSPATRTATVAETGNIIKVYYEGNPTYTYTVRYFKDDESTTVPFTTYTGGPTEATTITYGTPVYPDYLPTGYELGEYSPTVTVNTANQVIDVHYVRVQISYTIEYYYNSTKLVANATDADYVKDATKTYNGTVPYGTTISYDSTTYPSGAKDGYSKNTTKSAATSIVITAANTYRVYFDIVPYTYTIEYYVDDELVDTITKTVVPGTTITYGTNEYPPYDPGPGYVITYDPSDTVAIDEDGKEITVTYTRVVHVAPMGFALDYAEIIIPETYFTISDTFGGIYTLECRGFVKANDEIASDTIYTVRQDGNDNNHHASLFDGDDETFEVTGGLEGGILYKTYVSNFEYKFYAVYGVYNNNELVGWIYREVTLVPATTIYFEDTNDFVYYSDGWTETPAVEGLAKAVFDDVYGGSDPLNNSDTLIYSGGTAHYFDITEYADDSRYAEFTFFGTGFDVVSHCGYNTGFVFVDIYDPDNVVNDEPEWKYGYVVDTFTGYAFSTDEGWHQTTIGETVHQVPIIHITGLDYDKYLVKITPVYDRAFKTGEVVSNKDGSFGISESDGRVEIVNGEVVATRFYLDAIRIYDPALGDETAESIYEQDGERNYKISKIGDLMKEGDAVYFVGQPKGKNITADYSTYGPKNEVYMRGKNHYVAIEITADEVGKIPTGVYVGASALDYTAEEETGEPTPPILEVNGVQYEIFTGTDMFYDFSSAFTADSWTKGDDGKYRATVVIRNANTDRNASILSLTNIKLTYSNEFPVVPGSGAFNKITDEAALLENALNVIKSNVKLGDVNDDGIVNLKDTALLKKLVSGAAEFDFFASLAADADSNGAINVRDVNWLKAAVAGN